MSSSRAGVLVEIDYAIDKSIELGETKPKSDGRVADQMVSAMVERGVRCVFGIPGGAISGIYDALMASSIEVVICQHEQMAVYLAYGHARATGNPAAIAVTAGPGVLNTITGIAAAYKDEVPMLLLAGDVRRPMDGRGALQDGGQQGLDVITMFRSVTKFADTVQQAQRGRSLVHEALDAAMSEPRGPALLRIPLDVTLEEVPSDPIRQACFGRLQVDEAACARVVEALGTARQPALFLGLGARLAGVGPVVQRIAERLRCPVICDVEAKGTFPESHSLSLGLFGVGGGAASTAYLEDCDALVTVGARLDDTTTNAFSTLLRPRFLAQIDHDPRRLGLAYSADVVMAAPLSAALEHIDQMAPLPSAHTALRRETQVQRARVLDAETQGAMVTQAPFDPRGAVALLQASFPEDTVWTSDIGNHLLAASRHLCLDLPDTFHTSVGLGGMGSGIGVAMGLAQAVTEEITSVRFESDDPMPVGATSERRSSLLLS